MEVKVPLLEAGYELEQFLCLNHHTRVLVTI